MTEDPDRTLCGESGFGDCDPPIFALCALATLVIVGIATLGWHLFA